MELETRSLASPPAIDPDRPNRVKGYAARFNEPSRVLAERGKVFREVLLPGTFTATLAKPLMGDIVALWQHGLDNRPPLGRTGSGTLRLWEDAAGLAFELDLPESAADVREAVGRRDVWGASFQFPNGSARGEWSRRDGELWRHLAAVELVEISLVIHPAYPTAGLRSAVVVPELPDPAGPRNRRRLMIAERE